MCRTIKMALVMNLLSILFSASLVRSQQGVMPLKFIKISENVTYDCIDIYKQPGLDHPSLKNHAIQMKPSISRYESRNQTTDDKPYKKNVCPNGTVPILRNTKEFITSSQIFTEKYFHSLLRESPRTHVAGVRSSNGPFHGVEAMFSAYLLSIGKDQASCSQIYVGSRLNNQINFISAGWMINPSQFGDGLVWTFGYWKGKDGKGCYSTTCPGFVQVSQNVPLVEPNYLKPGVPGWLDYYIYQDKNTGNWWLTQFIATQFVPHASTVDIGYWPKELFNLFDSGANIVGVGGIVQASHYGLSPPMGNGKFPNGGLKNSAIFAKIEVLNSNYERRKMNSFSTEKLLDNTKCYGIRYGKVKRFHRSQLGFFFNYGGPGGNSCVI